MKSRDLQKFFFTIVKDKIPDHKSMVDEIAEILDISNDSAYRRIRGDKQIDFGEISKLAKHFQISIDQIVNSSNNSFLFYGQVFVSDEFQFENYLTDMMNHVKYISSIPDHHFYFDAKDIPPFQYYLYPNLAAFKLYFWMKNVIVDSRFDKLNFQRTELIENLISTGNQIAHAYKSINSTEIWVKETINSTTRQIEYCYDSGFFDNKGDCVKIYEELLELLEHIEIQAQYGEKVLPGISPTGRKNFKLYVNDILLGHNTALVVSQGKKSAFVNYSNVNFMHTYNEDFCNYIESTLETVISKSNIISEVNERERIKFFKELRLLAETSLKSIS